MVDQEAANALAECVARIRQLEEENAHLRQAAQTFGDLAERLKHALEIELGHAPDGIPDDSGRTALPGGTADPQDELAVQSQPPVRLVK